MKFSKKVLLFVAAVILLTGFFLLPVNRQWARTVFSYWNDFKKQKNNFDTESRMRQRFGTHYTYSVLIADSARKKGLENSTILLPPTTYFKKMGMNYWVPISPTFYYYTGIKTVWADNPHAAEADAYIRVVNGRMIIEKVTDRKALQDSIAVYKQLGINLWN